MILHCLPLSFYHRGLLKAIQEVWPPRPAANGAPANGTSCQQQPPSTSPLEKLRKAAAGAGVAAAGTDVTVNVKAVVFDWAGTTIDYGSRAPLLAFLEVFRWVAGVGWEFVGGVFRVGFFAAVLVVFFGWSFFVAVLQQRWQVLMWRSASGRLCLTGRAPPLTTAAAPRRFSGEGCWLEVLVVGAHMGVTGG